MNQKESIQNNISILNELTSKIELAKRRGGFFSYFKIKGLKKERRRIEIKTHYMVRAWLEEHDSEYGNLVRKNYALLKENALTFKVYGETYMFFGTYTTEMTG